MATCHLLRRKLIHALPDRQSDPCSKTGCRSHDWRLYTMVMRLTEAILYMYGVVSVTWENPPCAFWIRCHWNRLWPSSGGTLGFTWQGMVSQQLATGWWKCQTPSGLWVDAYLHEQGVTHVVWRNWTLRQWTWGNWELLSKIYCNRSLLKESRPWLVACHAESVL